MHFREELCEGFGGGEGVVWEAKEGVLKGQVCLRGDGGGDLEDDNPLTVVEPVNRRAEEWVEGV